MTAVSREAVGRFTGGSIASDRIVLGRYICDKNACASDLCCRLAAFLSAFVLVFGCGKSNSVPGAVSAVGTVTFNGAPLAGAQVTFYPANSDTALTSQAMTDAAGRYELSTHVGGGKFSPGIAAGKYSVAITKLDTASIASTLGPPKNVLPAKYADPKTSNLSADVTAGTEKSFDFALTAK